MYTLFGSIQSRTFRVLWALEEMGLEYSHYPTPPHSDPVTERNASGKIPVLVEDETIITDSVAIMTYLADKHSMLTAPAGTIARAHQDAMTFKLVDELDSLLWTAARHSFILPEDMRVPQVKDSLKAEFEANLARIEEDLDGPYLMGEAFTLPDIVLTHCLNWAYAAKFPTGGEGIKDYGKRCRAREAFKHVKAMGEG
jgi:glutathione S-transferase